MSSSREREVGRTAFRAGWHEGVPMARYLADTAVSASMLWRLHENTPAHLLDDLRAPEPPTTDAKELGNVVHSAVFEPAEFDDRYVVIGQCEAVKKGDGERCDNAGKVWRDGQSYCGVKGHDPYDGRPMDEGIYTIPEKARDDALAMKRALYSHPTAGEILSAPGPRECTGVFQDPVTGLWCRIRPDLLIHTPDEIRPELHRSAINLKSTGKSAKVGRYYRDAERMGTEFKAAFYLLGLRELLDYEPQHFLYPVVESGGGHQVIVYRLDDVALMVGEAAVRQALNTLARCVETGRWEGYGPQVHALQISEWRIKQMHDIDFLEVA